MTRYKILAVDLDDTLLTREKTISEQNKKWIRKAYEDGIHVVISTGRGYHNMKHFREELELKAPMVLVNGAEAWDEHASIIRRDYIEQDDLHFLHDLTDYYHTDFWAYGNEVFVRKPEWKHGMLDEQWTQFVIRHEDEKVLQHVSDAVNARKHTMEVTSSSPVNVEFTLKGVSKASGLRAVCDYLNCRMEDVMAIGDNHNDMQMIKSVGLGIAMGNAVPALQGIADDITETNQEDGVARAIQKHLYHL